MQDTAYDKPVVVIDFANNLIRIHKKTILSLGSPEHILLLINPGQLAFGIIGCKKEVCGSHRIRFRKTHCYELYSKSLVSEIKKILPCWEAEKSYRFTGDYVYKERIARFNLSESVPLKTDEVNISLWNRKSRSHV